MKKFIFLLFILAPSFSHAQINVGIKAGYNLSKVTGDWDALLVEQIQTLTGFNIEILNLDLEFESKFRSGFQAGFFAEIKLIENFYLQPEVIYSLKGVRFNDTFEFDGEYGGTYLHIDGEYNYDQKINYLEIPVLAKYKSNKGFSIFAGPFVSFLLSAKGEAVIEANVNTNYFGFPVNAPQEFTQDGLETDNFNEVDFGIAAGLGYEFPFGFGIDARYVKGMINISADLEDEMFTTSSMQIGLSYKIVTIGNKE